MQEQRPTTTGGDPDETPFLSPQSTQECEQLAIHHLANVDPEFVRELLAGFFTRLRGELDELKQLRTALEATPQDQKLLESLRFRMHRLAGTCAMLGLAQLSNDASRCGAAARRVLAPENEKDRHSVLATLSAVIESVVAIL